MNGIWHTDNLPLISGGLQCTSCHKGQCTSCEGSGSVH